MILNLEQLTELFIRHEGRQHPHFCYSNDIWVAFTIPLGSSHHLHFSFCSNPDWKHPGYPCAGDDFMNQFWVWIYSKGEQVWKMTKQPIAATNIEHAIQQGIAWWQENYHYCEDGDGYII